VLVKNGSPAWMKRPMHRGEKTARAGRYGATGMLLMSMQMGTLPLVGSRGFEEGQQLPAASISYESGMELIRRLQTAGVVHLRLDMQHRLHEAQSSNVIGDLPGRAWPQRYIVVGAHYDSHDIAPGAIDDAAGVAIALEVARLLSRTNAGVGRSVRVIAFGAEELGLLGSQAYVAAHTADLDQIDFMVNLDCAGGPGGKTLTVHAWPALRDLMRAATDDIMDLTYADWISSTHSDHFPFLLAGVPTATLTGGSSEGNNGHFMHTAADTLDKVQAEHLQAEAVRVARAVLRLSWSEQWPGKRRAPADVKRVLEDAGLLKELAYEGRFPFGS